MEAEASFPHNDEPVEQEREIVTDPGAGSDALTPETIALTPRQQRVLRYLARRHMRHARVVPRSHSYDDDSDETEVVDLGTLDTVPLAKGAVVEGSLAASAPIIAVIPSKPLVKVQREAPPAALPPLPPMPTRAALDYAPRDDSRLRYRRKLWLRHYSRKQMRLARTHERRSRRHMWLSLALTALTIFVIVSGLGTAGTLVAYHFYDHTVTTFGPQVVSLRDLLPLDSLKIYDSKGVLLTQMTQDGLHTSVPLAQIAPIMQKATVDTEDKNFWSNEGIDIQGIIRAALDNMRSGRVVEGGSTITQQLIKNLIVGNQETIERKLEEVALTPSLNSRYSKSDILEMYFNSIYYGEQAYGVDAAASVYFGLQDLPGKSAASQLDLAQAAMLAGIPSNPAAFDPVLHPQAAQARFQTVLNTMLLQHDISKLQMLDALQEAQSPHFFKTTRRVNRAPHFTNFVIGQLEQQYHMTRDQLARSGMIVYTTLNVALQDKIQKVMQQHIAALRYTHNVSNAAEVLIDFHTGAIISLLGSVNYYDTSIDGQFDVATQGYRQPGSSFKPYVYVTAFQDGISPGQAIDDAPTTIDNAGGSPPYYSPTNYDLSYHGQMTLRCALQNSLNVPAVRVLYHVGVKNAMQMARNMGITSYEGTPGYSLVLGGLSVRLIDHTSAMGTFADGGVHVPYYAVNQIVQASTGKVIYQHKNNTGKRVISPQLAYMMTSVLSDNTDRLPEFYNCNVLQLYTNSQADCFAGNRGAVRPAAAKTGTTNDFRDNWTIGYTTDYVMGVWAGNDNNTPMYNITGVDGAAPIWHDSMLLAEQGRPIRDFSYPGGLVKATVTYPNGVTSTDWYLPGKVPTFAQPTPTPSPAESPTATVTPTAQTDIAAQPGMPAPYCSSFRFAFPPAPPSNIPPPGAGWW